MLEVSASVELSGLSRFRSRPCCLPPRLTASALHSKRFRSSILSPHVPLSNASGPALRRVPHDSGSGWFATPFLCDSFIHYSMPVFTSAPDDRCLSSAYRARTRQATKNDGIYPTVELPRSQEARPRR